MLIPLNHDLILASQSPRRKKIFQMLGLKFEVAASNIDENKVPKNITPEEVPEFLARKKSKTVSLIYKTKLVLGFDTSVFIGKSILGKPSNSTEALKMLRKLNGKSHKVISGVSLAKGGRILKSNREITKVKFCENQDSLLQKYAESSEPLDKAGSYGIQGQGALFVEKIQGCYNNVVGVPIQKTMQLLNPYLC